MLRSISFCKNICINYGLFFVLLLASSTRGEETVYPQINNISVSYSFPATIIQTGGSLFVMRSITNNAPFPLTNLYLSENIPAEFNMDSSSLKINGTEIPCTYIGPLEDEIITGCHTSYWLIDEPVSEDSVNHHLMPGETLDLEYYLSCSTSGFFELPLHTTCFYGNNTGFFSVGNRKVTFVSDPTCGDINSDKEYNILDITYLINYRYKDGPSPDLLESADVNNDGAINILDIVYLINFIYKEGPDPACPASAG